jgi:hypothetical protein
MGKGDGGGWGMVGMVGLEEHVPIKNKTVQARQHPTDAVLRISISTNYRVQTVVPKPKHTKPLAMGAH